MLISDNPTCVFVAVGSQYGTSSTQHCTLDSTACGACVLAVQHTARGLLRGARCVAFLLLASQ